MPTFHVAGSIEHFNVPKKVFLDRYAKAPYNSIATSTIVVNDRIAGDPRVLLLQRAASDSDPNKWEPPGGACEDGEVILEAADRELEEEAGLTVEEFLDVVDVEDLFTVDNTLVVRQFGFAVRVRTNDDGKDGSGALVSPVVRLDPREHQNFVWATKAQVEAGKAGDIDLDFTRDEVRKTVLQAFDVFEKDNNKENFAAN